METAMSVFSLKGKVALVTGARSGIGQAIALGFTKAGAELILLGHQDNMQETEKLIEDIGGSYQTMLADLSKPDQILQLCEEQLSKLDINILVNCAGIIKRQKAIEYSKENWDNVIDVNLNSIFVLSQQLAKNMVKKGEGKIINIASLLSFQGGLFVPAYAASKHAVVGLTKAFANEWAANGVQVNAIAPGYIETNVTVDIQKDAERNATILSRIPANRWGKPDDIAGAAIFLASSASNYVNGHVLVVDGGWMSR